MSVKSLISQWEEKKKTWVADKKEKVLKVLENLETKVPLSADKEFLNRRLLTIPFATASVTKAIADEKEVLEKQYENLEPKVPLHTDKELYEEVAKAIKKEKDIKPEIIKEPCTCTGKEQCYCCLRVLLGPYKAARLYQLCHMYRYNDTHLFKTPAELLEAQAIEAYCQINHPSILKSSMFKKEPYSPRMQTSVVPGTDFQSLQDFSNCAMRETFLDERMLKLKMEYHASISNLNVKAMSDPQPKSAIFEELFNAAVDSAKRHFQYNWTRTLQYIFNEKMELLMKA